MSSFSTTPEGFLSELEEFLEQGPQGDDKQLGDVLVRLTKNENANLSEKAFQLLGTAVGKQNAWQLPFRESGILAHVVQNLELSAISAALAKQYLRVIGNCVADNDSNREIVTEEFEKLIACLPEGDLTTTALAVMFNLSTDFEPARVEAAKLRLDNILVDYLVVDRIPEAAIDYAADLLHWTTDKLTPIQLQDDTSLKVFSNILSLSLQYDEDRFQEYAAILVHYLQDLEFQQKVAAPDTVEKLLDILLDFESRMSPEEIQDVFQELDAHNDPNKVESEDMNVVLMVRLVNSLSAMSASDAFVRTFHLESPFVKKLVSILVEQVVYPSTVCVCVMLGNLATSDQVCIDMVQKFGLHLILIATLKSCQEYAILYAAAGFMRHLTFPLANRTVLGEAGLIEVCCHLLTLEDPSVRGEAAAILCKLATNDYVNIKKMIHEAIPASITPTQLPSIEVPEHLTILYHIISQALAPSGALPSTTMKNPMIELGRTLIAILRHLRRSDTGEDVDTVLQQVFKTPVIARPIARLVRQRFYAEARSEGLLGLGLLAQSPEGAVCVVKEMKDDAGLLEAIKEFAIEQKGGQKDNAAAGRDYQNAVVLLHGLATNGADAMDSSLRGDIETLQTELSRLME